MKYVEYIGLAHNYTILQTWFVLKIVCFITSSTKLMTPDSGLRTANF
jgi:hypothetical protein